MCRSRRELSNAYLLAKIGVDTAENEPLEVWGENSIQYSLRSLLQTELALRALPSHNVLDLAFILRDVRRGERDRDIFTSVFVFMHRPRITQLDVVGANLRFQCEDQPPRHLNLDAVVLRQCQDVVVACDEMRLRNVQLLSSDSQFKKC